LAQAIDASLSPIDVSNNDEIKNDKSKPDDSLRTDVSRTDVSKTDVSKPQCRGFLQKRIIDEDSFVEMMVHMAWTTITTTKKHFD